MRMRDGELKRWKLLEVYGIIYGYSVYFKQVGVFIKFFIAFTDSDCLLSHYCLHYTAFSITSEIITFNITMTCEESRSSNTKLSITSNHLGRALSIRWYEHPIVELIDCGQYHGCFTDARGGGEVRIDITNGE